MLHASHAVSSMALNKTAIKLDTQIQSIRSHNCVLDSYRRIWSFFVYFFFFLKTPGSQRIRALKSTYSFPHCTLSSSKPGFQCAGCQCQKTCLAFTHIFLFSHSQTSLPLWRCPCRGHSLDDELNQIKSYL